MAHRGPDGSTTLHGANWTMLGTHLCILPGVRSNTSLCAAGLQQRSGIAFNGEIFNYRDVAASLGVSVQSDTDLLSALMGRDPASWIEKVGGMFAIAICRSDELILIRDRFGIKPLFYTRNGAGRTSYRFASELKALIQERDDQVVLDRSILSEISAFGFAEHSERTLISEIMQVPPGCIVRLRIDGSVNTTRFGKAICQSRDLQKRKQEEAASVLKDLLHMSVSAQVRHDDCKKAFFLSGGVDSTALVYSAVAQGLDVHTLTLSADGNDEDAVWAQQVAATLGTCHTEVHWNVDDFWRALGPYIRNVETLELPGVFDAFGGLAFYALCQEAKKIGVRVVFTGEGADELFGGYYWPYTHPLGFVDRLRSQAEPFADVKSYLRSFFPHPEDPVLYRELVFQWMLGAALTNYHLWCVDRCSMAFSIEARPPFLDDHLVDYAVRLPVPFLCNDRETKIVLRDVLRNDLCRVGLSGLLGRRKLAMPSAATKFSESFRDVAQKVYCPVKSGRHPFRKSLRDDAASLLSFDLFYFLMVERRAAPVSDVEWLEIVTRLRFHHESPIRW